MNPWPDDYTEPPDELTAYRAWMERGPTVTVGHYLHWLTEELAGLQALCDEQAAELAGVERCDECDGGFW